MTASDFCFPDPAARQAIRRRLLPWFRRHARDLPWRRTRDPYCVWVSEIMLQQTQVATVIDYYQRFLAAFPTVAALARADEQQVLRLWEGLGYYRRARQLHAAAQQIIAEHGGRFPRDIDAVRRLPGVGRYTAGAIASIAWDARAPILEANSTRVFCRWLAYRGDPASAAGQRLLWSLAEDVLPRKNVGLFNQAVMELGSRVCTPRTPACEDCPVRLLCPTRAHGLQPQIPQPKRPTAYEAVREAAVVIRRGDRVLIRRCAPDERWAGLWDFPRFGVTAADGPALAQELAEHTRRLTGLTVELLGPLATLKHGVTRFRITLECYQARVLAGRLRPSALRWVSPAELTAYPLSVTGRQIARLLHGEEGHRWGVSSLGEWPDAPRRESTARSAVPH